MYLSAFTNKKTIGTPTVFYLLFFNNYVISACIYIEFDIGIYDF